jgi:hypothetical protein
LYNNDSLLVDPASENLSGSVSEVAQTVNSAEPNICVMNQLPQTFRESPQQHYVILVDAKMLIYVTECRGICSARHWCGVSYY